MVKLANNYTDIILLLRNPSGKCQRGAQWTGDWAADCDLWTKHTKKQVSPAQRMASNSTFWMSLGDFIDEFEQVTVSFSDNTFAKRVLPADIVDEKELEDEDAPSNEAAKRGATANKGWGIIHISGKLHARQAFFRLCQLDRKFQDRGDDKPDLEFAELTLLVVKKFKSPPTAASARCGMEYAYLEGVSAKKASVGVRIDGMRGGDYLIIYKANWKPKHACQKLNLVYGARQDILDAADIKRIKPSSYRSSFFTRLLKRHEGRVAQAGHYDQP